MNLVLIGYRGTGKSTVGKLVSARLGMEFISMDDEIVSRTGTTVSALVAAHGWSRFRDLESGLCVELGGRDGLVIDTGGGVIERPENIGVLRERGVVCWLKGSVASLAARLADDTSRPALTNGMTFLDEIAAVLARRTPLYRAASDFELDTDGTAPEALADAVVEMFRKRCGESR